jgi:hypothetical protein
MRFSDSRLHEAIAGWREATDPETRSELDNVWFEERVNARRQETFEEEIGEVHTWAELRQRQVDYWQTFVKVGDGFVPHTFADGFVARDLSEIDEKQKVVRIESVARPLSASALTFTRLREAMAKGEHDIVERFVRTWNESSIRDARPVFATVTSAVADDLDEPDWPERLRDRLGLAHYDAAAGPEPIALMEYRVEEIVEAAQSAGITCALTAPTFLDSGPWPFFFRHRPSSTAVEPWRCSRSGATTIWLSSFFTFD